MGGKRVPDLTIPRESVALAYLAGIIDGEGCISVDAVPSPSTGAPSHNLRVVVTNTSERLILWLKSIGGTVRLSQRRTVPRHWLPIYRWVVHGKNASTLLAAILPFLVIKRDQAMLALEFMALPSGRRGSKPLDPALLREREIIAAKLTAAKQIVN